MARFGKDANLRTELLGCWWECVEKKGGVSGVRGLSNLKNHGSVCEGTIPGRGKDLGIVRVAFGIL